MQQNPIDNPKTMTAMLDGLIAAFTVANATGRLHIQYNHGDIAHLLMLLRDQQKLFPMSVK